MQRTLIAALVLVIGLMGQLHAKQAYVEVPMSALDTKGKALPAVISLPWNGESQALLRPRAVLSSGEEAYVTYNDQSYYSIELSNMSLVVHAEAGSTLTGTLFLPSADRKALDSFPFTTTLPPGSQDAEVAFLTAKKDYYKAMTNAGFSGTAWFRYEMNSFKRALADKGLPIDTSSGGALVSGEMQDSMELFTGGMALSENLQLDRILNPPPSTVTTVDISEVVGLEVKEIDWAPLIKGLAPEKDALASMIPHDQYGLFFPTFGAMTALIEEADSFGTPILSWLKPRSESAMTKDRYQTQLTLSVSKIAKLLGPKVVKTVAFTGSDPFLSMGSDVAILFEASQPNMLKSFLEDKHDKALAATPTAERVDGAVGGVTYRGVVTKDKAISSYLAQIGDVFVVTNSLVQLERIVATHKGDYKAMATLGEYTYFRDRYKKGDPTETALLIVTDAAIRKWASPAWRIADSRRVYAAAYMGEMTAAHLDELVAGGFDPKPLSTPPGLPDAGSFSLTPDGVTSSVYGSLAFMTPIAELAITKVTSEEKEAYDSFRNSYQQRWRQFFDPIAIKFTVTDDEVGLDMTVMPLIMESEYEDLVELTGTVAIPAEAGQPTKGTLFRYAMGLNPDSKLVKMANSMGAQFSQSFGGDALAWLGEWAVFSVHDAPLWKNAVASKKPDNYLEDHLSELPISLEVAITSPFKAAAFLSSFRAFVQGAAPGMLLWETKEVGKKQYVKIAGVPGAIPDKELQDLALYYTTVEGKSLYFTFNEQLVKDALKRPKPNGKETPWLGGNVSAQVDDDVLTFMDEISKKDYTWFMQQKSWGNLVVLDEWKKKYPDEDPLALHEKIWHTKLICPGGGTYSYDAEAKTMVSSVYGTPMAPKKGPGMVRPPLDSLASGNFGLTFEAEDGLRVKVTLKKKKK